LAPLASGRVPRVFQRRGHHGAADRSAGARSAEGAHRPNRRLGEARAPSYKSSRRARGRLGEAMTFGQRGRSIGDGARLFAAVLLFAGLAYVGIETTRESGRIALLWLPNGLIAAWLLRDGARLTVPALIGCALADLIVNLAMGDPLGIAAALALANGVEIGAVVALLRRSCGPRPDMAEPRCLAWLLPMALLAAALSGAVTQSAFWLFERAPGLVIWRTWLLADGLSLVIILPIALIAIDQWHARRWPTAAEARDWLAMIALAAAGTWLIFGQSAAPWLFLVGPIVLYAAFRTGLSGTAVAMAIVTLIASLATFEGLGPITLVRGLGERVLTFQLFLIANFAMGIPVAALLAARARSRRARRRGRGDAGNSRQCPRRDLPHRRARLLELAQPRLDDADRLSGRDEPGLAGRRAAPRRRGRRGARAPPPARLGRAANVQPGAADAPRRWRLAPCRAALPPARGARWRLRGHDRLDPRH